MKNIMKSKKGICLLAGVCVIIAVIGVLIARGAGSKCPAPFSTLTWESGFDEMINTEGDGYNTSESVYGGTTYEYPKEFEGISGTVKYMYDDKNALMCIGWSCTADDSDTLKALYNKISSSVNSKYGESGYQPNSINNFGNVWYRDEGNIILFIAETENFKALQYSYLHPDVSHKKE